MKRTLALIMMLVIALSLSSCGAAGKTKSTPAPEADIVWTNEPAAPAEDGLTVEEAAFTFAELENLQFTFSSGAGGWATVLTVDADGRFSGQFHDSNMGEVGEGYSGAMLLSNFTGQFSQPVKVNDYTYSMYMTEISYGPEFGTEEIIDGTLYCYGDAYGLEGGEEFLLYLPGSPLKELPEGFRGWIGYYYLENTQDTQLPFYALNNVKEEYGFSSFAMEE